MLEPVVMVMTSEGGGGGGGGDGAKLEPPPHPTMDTTTVSAANVDSEAALRFTKASPKAKVRAGP